jgi:hypothetical protein
MQNCKHWLRGFLPLFSRTYPEVRIMDRAALEISSNTTPGFKHHRLIEVTHPDTAIAAQVA